MRNDKSNKPKAGKKEGLQREREIGKEKQVQLVKQFSIQNIKSH